jgi:hypothetical protein
LQEHVPQVFLQDSKTNFVPFFFSQRNFVFFFTQAQFFAAFPLNANDSSSKQLEASVETGAFVGLAVGAGVLGIGVGAAVGGVVGALVGFVVAFVGASVFFVGAAVETGAFVGLAVGAGVLGTGVGAAVGGCGSTSSNISSTVKRKLSGKLCRLGKTSFIFSFGTPNQTAMPLKTASQGVDGIIRPLPNVRGPSSVKLSGYSPRICPPFTDPPCRIKEQVGSVSDIIF